MAELADRRYSISEVGEITGVSAPVLRQWEKNFSMLKPRRDRAGRRYYVLDDIEVVRSIKYLLWHKGMTAKGAARCLAEERHTRGHVRTRQDALSLIAKIEAEAKAMLERLS